MDYRDLCSYYGSAESADIRAFIRVRFKFAQAKNEFSEDVVAVLDTGSPRTIIPKSLLTKNGYSEDDYRKIRQSREHFFFLVDYVSGYNAGANIILPDYPDQDYTLGYQHQIVTHDPEETLIHAKLSQHKELLEFATQYVVLGLDFMVKHLVVEFYPMGFRIRPR